MMLRQTRSQKRKYEEEFGNSGASWVPNKRIVIDADTPMRTAMLHSTNHHLSSMRTRPSLAEPRKDNSKQPHPSSTSTAAVPHDQLAFQKTREYTTIDAWRNEWWSQDGDDLPSYRRPLSLLCEPSRQDVESHERNTSRVFLITMTGT
jgi:hypothetical protein